MEQPGGGDGGPSSHALNSDLDTTPPMSSTSTPLSDYSPHSQPFAERPAYRTSAGVAAQQGRSSLPSPPPFTPAVPGGAGAQSIAQELSVGGSNNLGGGQADTPGVTSAWQPSPSAGQASSSATFAFTPVEQGDASPDSRPFAAGAAAAQQVPAPQPVRSAVQQQQQQQPPRAAAQLVRSAAHALSGASEASDTRSDVSGGSMSSASTASHSMGPGQSPGSLIREATSRLRSDKAISGSKRLHSTQRSKASFKTPAGKGVVAAPTPHPTPMDTADMRRSDDLADEASSADTGVLGVAAAAAAAAAAAEAAAAGAAAGPADAAARGDDLMQQSPGSLKLAGTPTTASPVKSIKSPGSRSSVVSIGSVCGPAHTPALVVAATDTERLEVGKYTPTMKLDFDSSPSGTPSAGIAAAAAAAVAAAAAAAAEVEAAEAADVVPAEAATPPLRPAAGASSAAGGADPTWSPINFQGIVDSLQDSTNKANLAELYGMLRGSGGANDALLMNDQLQADLAQAEEDAAAFVSGPPSGRPTAPASTAAGLGGGGNSSSMAASGARWLRRNWALLLLWLLAAASLAFCSLMVVQLLPPTLQPPGAVCTPDNAAACRAALAAAQRAAQKEPTGWRLGLLRAKWHMQDFATVMFTRRLPEGVTEEQLSRAWLGRVSEQQVQAMSTAHAQQLFGSLPAQLRTPAIEAKLQAAAAERAAAERAAAEAAARAAREAAEAAAREEAEREAAARAAREAAEKAAREAAAKAAAEKAAREKAERQAAEKAARAKAAAEKAAREKAEREAAEKAAREAAAKAAAKKAALEKAERQAAEKAAREAAAKAAAEKAALEKAEREAAQKAAREAAAQVAAEKAALEKAEREAAEKAAREAAAKAAALEQAEREAAEAAARAAAEEEAAENAAREAAERAVREAAEAAAAEHAAREAGVRAAAMRRRIFAALAGLAASLPCLSAGVWLWPLLAARLLAVRTGAAGPATADLDDIRSHAGDDVAAELLDDEADDPMHEEDGDGLLHAGALAGAGGSPEGAAAAVLRILTPLRKAPVPPPHTMQEGEEADADEGAARAPRRASRGAAPSRSARSTPARAGRRSSAAAAAAVAAEAGEEEAAAPLAQEAPRSSGRGGRRAGAPPTPRTGVLQPLPEDAPADQPAGGLGPGAAGDAEQQEQQEQHHEEEGGAPAGRRGRRQSAPAASVRRRSSTAAAATAAGGDEASTPGPPAGRRSTRAARTPRV